MHAQKKKIIIIIIYVHRFVDPKFTNTELQVDTSGTTQESSKRQHI